MNPSPKQRRKRRNKSISPATFTRCRWCKLQINSLRFKKHSHQCMQQHTVSADPEQTPFEEGSERETQDEDSYSLHVDESPTSTGSSLGLDGDNHQSGSVRSSGENSSDSANRPVEGDDDSGLLEYVSGSLENVFDSSRSEPKVYQFAEIETITNPTHKLSVKLLSIVNRYNVPRACHNELTELFNEAMYLKDPKCEHMLSPFLAQEAAKPLFPVKLRRFPVCRNGCMLFAETNESAVCTFCGANKYTDASSEATDPKPYATVQMLPLREQLAFMLHNPATRDLLLYRSTRQHQDGYYEDVFDGTTYQEHISHLFTSKFDIAVGLYVDGFQPFKGNSKHAITIIHVIILNIDPSFRYENKNMMQICIIPGPKRPMDLWSFLGPILDELDNLQNQGMIIKSGADIIHAKVHLLFATGDLPAVTCLANHAGHTSLNGCRICLTVGVHPPGSSRGVFFPTSNRHLSEWHTVQGYQTASEDGIKVPTRFAFMKTFHGPEFFGLDEMHLLGHGISRQFLALIQGDYTVSGASNPFHIAQETLIGIMQDMEYSRSTVPTAFQGSWKSFINRLKIRAVDWMDFICYVVPTLVFKRLADAGAKRATMALVSACQTCLQYSMSEANVDDLKRDITIWHDFLTQLVEKRILTVSVFTPSQHYLSHAPELIRKLGPMRYYSARSMERAIGLYSRLISSRSAPGTNASNIMSRLAIERYMGYVTEVATEETSMVIPSTSMEPKTRGAGKQASLDSMLPIAGVTLDAFERALRAFYRRIGDAGVICREFTYYGSAWYNNRVFGSALQHSERNRAAYFVRLSISVDRYAKSPRRTPQMERRFFFGKVYFYFQCTVQGSATLLAVVGIYKVQRTSSHIYIHPSTTVRLFIVHSSDIDEFVGLVAERRFGAPSCQYCIWPGMISSNKYINEATIGNIQYL